MHFCYDLGYTKATPKFNLCTFKISDAPNINQKFEVNFENKDTTNIGHKKFNETILDTL